MDNWGVKEIKVENKAVMITFSKTLIYVSIIKLANPRSGYYIPDRALVPVRQIKLSPMESQAVLQIALLEKLNIVPKLLNLIK